LDTLQIEREVELRATPEQVFAALSTEIGAWWDHTFADEPRGLHLEPYAGGRFYEEFGDNGSALYALVTYAEPDKLLVLSGSMGMRGPVLETVRYELAPCERGTLLKLAHRVVGEVDDETREIYTTGWDVLLNGQLKEYLEQREL